MKVRWKDISFIAMIMTPVSRSFNHSHMVIEAIFGLGEAIVSGEVTPDLYVVDKAELKIVERRLGRQEWQLVKSPVRSLGRLETNIKVTIPPELQGRQKLADRDILALAQWGKRIEELYQFPQDIEWAREGPRLYIVQSRPVTSLQSVAQAIKAREAINIEGTPCLSGVAASPGVVAGPVKVLSGPTELAKVQGGDVLVARMTTPDYVPA